MHAHHYHQYGFSASAVFKLKSEEEIDSQAVRSFFVPSDLPHRVILTGSDTALMVWLDPELRIERGPSVSGSIETSLIELETLLEPLNKKTLDCEVAGRIRHLITGRTAADHRKLDERISDSLDWVKQHLTEQTITVEQLSGTVYLSSSRFMHLFSEEIGIPVRKYILWQRLKQALLIMAQGRSITEAAHEAGFTDSSHMNRSFNAMFGITPSKIFKNSRFVQVIPC